MLSVNFEVSGAALNITTNKKINVGTRVVYWWLLVVIGGGYWWHSLFGELNQTIKPVDDFIPPR